MHLIMHNFLHAYMYIYAHIYTRIIVGIFFALIIFSANAFAQSASTSYRLDYERSAADVGSKSSASYNLIGAIPSFSANGDSTNYRLRNIYANQVVSAVCGNGVIEGSEQCEGNNFNGSTCQSFGFTQGLLTCSGCAIDTSGCYTPGGGGGGVTFVCGNGIQEGGEQCDDGNTSGGDGCSAFCRKESQVCGNGIIEIGEQCDDGNINLSDGCTPMCTLEVGGEGEGEIVGGKGEGEGKLGFNLRPATESKPFFEIKPEPKTIIPAKLHGVSPERRFQKFHFENYEIGGVVTILDETPFVVLSVEPNQFYEFVIYNAKGEIITRQGVKSDQSGIVKVESIAYLNYETYTFKLFNANREVEKEVKFKIEDRKYRLHDLVMAKGDTVMETICLGQFKQSNKTDKTNFIDGKGKAKTRYFAYYQSSEIPLGQNINPITVIKVTADDEGNFKIPIPKHLESGLYHADIVQVYEDGKVSRNKRYSFVIFQERKQNIWILILITLVTILGQIKRINIFVKSKFKENKKKINSKKSKITRNKNQKSRIKNRVSKIIILLLAISIISTPLANAAITTPGVFVYEGKLLDTANVAITTAQTFRFSLWSSDDLVAGDITGAGEINTLAPAYGGWQETQTTTPNSDGTFFFDLGSVTPLPDMTVGTHDYLMVEIKPSGSPDTSYELMDPSGDAGADADDRQTVGSTPFTNNADFIDNAELGTSAGDIVSLSAGDVWDINHIPGGTNADSFIIDHDDTVVAGSIDLQFGNTLGETISFDITNDWFDFSNDISLEQNELKNVAIDNLALAPIAPVTGQIYYNTVDGNTYIWNGTVWEDITVGAAGGNDLDSSYNLGQNITVDGSGDLIFNLNNTEDFIIQDSGSPFAIFTDTGEFGIGNTVPSSVLHADSNSVNTDAILTLENTAGDFQLFRSDATPESNITGSIGDMVIDGTNGNAYIKNSGNLSNTGWLQIGGKQEKELVFKAEYEDAVAEGDGTNNRGTLISDYTNAGGTSKNNFYEWTTAQASIQDVDIVTSIKLPLDFVNFTTSPLSILYKTSDADTLKNNVGFSLYDTTGTAVTLTGGSTLASATWATAGITFGGSPTFTPGGTITIIGKMSSTNAGYARIGDMIFTYNGT